MLTTKCCKCDCNGLEIGSNDKGSHVYIHCNRCNNHVDMFFDSPEDFENLTVGMLFKFYNDASVV